MCVNYTPTRREQLEALLGVSLEHLADWPPEAWKDYIAPIVRHNRHGEPEVVLASYGLVPRRHIPPRVRAWDTMNARAESIGAKRSFAGAWRGGQLCLVPMRCFFEPNYESGRAERWRIGLADGAVFAVAGLWREWEEADGTTSVSFTQITINADEHALMRRFHKPGDEKRALVIVPPQEHASWLACRDPELARSFLRHYPAERMAAEPAPKGGAAVAVQAALF